MSILSGMKFLHPCTICSGPISQPKFCAEVRANQKQFSERAVVVRRPRRNAGKKNRGCENNSTNRILAKLPASPPNPEARNWKKGKQGSVDQGCHAPEQSEQQPRQEPVTQTKAVLRIGAQPRQPRSGGRMQPRACPELVEGGASPG